LAWARAGGPGGRQRVSACCTVPALPSTVTSCPVRSRVVASPVPTTAGMPYSRATSEAWAARVPPSVTTAAARVKRGVQAGAVTLATRTSPPTKLAKSSGPLMMDQAGGASRTGGVANDRVRGQVARVSGLVQGSGDGVADQSWRLSQGERGDQAALPLPGTSSVAGCLGEISCCPGERAGDFGAGQEEEVIECGNRPGGDQVLAEETGADPQQRPAQGEVMGLFLADYRVACRLP